MNIFRFYGPIFRENRLRKRDSRSLSRDVWLYMKNRILQQVERPLVNRYAREPQPMVFIVGAPRSGTTLLFQLMARHLAIGYVNNFMARYWMAPLYGAMRYRRKFGDRRRFIALESHLGGTSGPEAPHEFSYFWQFWMDSGSSDALTDEQLACIDWPGIRQELHALSGWMGQPLVLKSINFVDYHIPWFAKQFPNSKFIHIRRDPFFVAQSILESRKQRYGTEDVWWSIRPRDVHAWLGKEPIQQVCYQIRDVLAAVENGFSKVGTGATLTLDYQELTQNPLASLENMSAFLQVPIIDRSALEELRLTRRDENRLPPPMFEALSRCLEAPHAP